MLSQIGSNLPFENLYLFSSFIRLGTMLYHVIPIFTTFSFQNRFVTKLNMEIQPNRKNNVTKCI